MSDTYKIEATKVYYDISYDACMHAEAAYLEACSYAANCRSQALIDALIKVAAAFKHLQVCRHIEKHRCCKLGYMIPCDSIMTGCSDPGYPLDDDIYYE